MKYFFGVFLIGISCSLFAQVGALSGDKLLAYSYDPLPLHVVELEPNFSFFNSASVWAEDGTQLEQAKSELSSSLCWRVTFGFAENFEIGAMFPSDLSGTMIGLKAFLFDAGAIKFSAMGGLNIPLGNRTYDPNNLKLEDKTNFAAGIIGSIKFDDSNAIDINVQYQDYFTDPVDIDYSAYFINAEFGSYFLHENIRTIIGFGYQNSTTPKNKTLNLLTLYPGFAFEFSDNIFLVLNSSHDVSGKNSDKSFGMNLACTMIIE